MKKIIVSIFAMFICTQAIAWEPTKNSTIDVLIPFPSGAGNELIFRSVAPIVEKNTGVKFNIVSKPGAGGAVGTELFKSWPADGLHIAVLSTGGLAAMDKVSLDYQQRKPYNTDTFTPVLQLGHSPAVIIAHPSDPVNNPQQLIDALLKDDVRMGHSGGGGRLAFEVFASRIDLDVKNKKFARVEYKGPAQTVPDVAGKHIRFGVLPLSVAAPFHKAGQVKIIALSSAEKIDSLPNVQTLASVLPGIDVPIAFGLTLPPGTKPEIVEWYRKEFSKALDSGETKSRYQEQFFFLNKKLLDPKSQQAYIKSFEKESEPAVNLLLKEIKK
jgi:tripartite-type tricarboxylate transporter receptor subunit TctC